MKRLAALVWRLMAILMISGTGQAALASDVRDATQAEIALLREGMSYQLKDAKSAEFRDVKARRGESGLILVCGDVNAKNSYGAYIGFTRFFASILHKKNGKLGAFVHSVDEKVASVLCSEYGF